MYSATIAGADNDLLDNYVQTITDTETYFPGKSLQINTLEKKEDIFMSLYLFLEFNITVLF